MSWGHLKPTSPAILLALLLMFSTQMPLAKSESKGPMWPRAVIEETLISVDDPTFGPYDPDSGNGTIARVFDSNGIKYFESLIQSNLIRPPPDDYDFRYLTGIPQVNTSRHWRLYFRHYVTNLREIEIENCQMDGWHAYLIAPDGVLWRLYKYQAQSPTYLPPNSTAVANMTYLIHNIPEHRVTFLFSLICGGTAIDSWRIGREVIKFVGHRYDLPKISLRRMNPGKNEISPPRFMRYSLSIKNAQEEDLDISLDYKIGETAVWEMNLWPFGSQGEIGSMEFTLKPREHRVINMSSYFPDDKCDHAVLIYFGVILLRGAFAPPLKAEVWENLYGSNSYLGIKMAWVSIDPSKAKSNGSGIELYITVAPYASPFSKDVLPGDHYVRLTIFDAHYREVVHGPVDLLIDAAIKKGSEMVLNYTIPKALLHRGEGRYMVQVDTFRRGEGGRDMNLARVSLPFQVRLPDLSIRGLEIADGTAGPGRRAIAKIENLGHWPAENAAAILYADREKICEKRISIGPGEVAIVEFDLEGVGKWSSISVECLPGGPFPDANPGDNRAILLAKEEGPGPESALPIAFVSIAVFAILIIMALRRSPQRPGDSRRNGFKDGQ